MNWFLYCHQDDRPRAEREKDELDHAIALSLAEEFKRPNGDFLIYGFQNYIFFRYNSKN